MSDSTSPHPRLIRSLEGEAARRYARGVLSEVGIPVREDDGLLSPPLPPEPKTDSPALPPRPASSSGTPVPPPPEPIASSASNLSLELFPELERMKGTPLFPDDDGISDDGSMPSLVHSGDLFNCLTLKNDGYGEFPDSYELTPRGVAVVIRWLASRGVSFSLPARTGRDEKNG